MRGPAHPPLLVIAGATATGKTGLSIRLARALNDDGIPAEVVSADSRQVYRGLDIGTAKAAPAERGDIPHHGLDLVEPDQPFTLVDYAGHARACLAGIAERRAIALLVGGSGLYLRAIARGIDTAALPSDPELRAGLEADLRRDGLDALVTRLRTVAPDRSARIDLRNPRRVVRALEVVELAGGGEPPPLHGYPGPVTWLALTVERGIHREWIATRARGQFEAGLIDEARALRERFDPALPAFSAIGYREAWSVIDGGATLDEAIAEDARRNHAFARRQRTWFRGEPAIEWLDATSTDPLPAARRAAAGLLARSAPRS